MVMWRFLVSKISKNFFLFILTKNIIKNIFLVTLKSNSAFNIHQTMLLIIFIVVFFANIIEFFVKLLLFGYFSAKMMLLFHPVDIFFFLKRNLVSFLFLRIFLSTRIVHTSCSFKNSYAKKISNVFFKNINLKLFSEYF